MSFIRSLRLYTHGVSFRSAKLPRVIASGLACGLLCGFTSCATRPSSIAVIPRTTGTLLWESLHQGVIEQAHADGYQVYWNAPANDGDSELQMDLFASVRRGGYRGFILSPDETLAARSVVLETIAEGFPVVIVDDELGPAAGPKLSYVSNDEAAGAQLAAEQIAHLLHGHGTIAVTGIITRLEDSLSRDDAFEQAIARIAPEIHITVRRFGDTVITHQQQIAQQILLQSQPVDAIVALSSTATQGAYYAKLAGGPSVTTPIVGFDQDFLLSLRTGQVNAIIAQNAPEIGQLAVKNLNDELHGTTPPAVTLVKPILLTRESLAQGAAASLLAYSGTDWSRQ